MDDQDKNVSYSKTQQKVMKLINILTHFTGKTDTHTHTHTHTQGFKRNLL